MDLPAPKLLENQKSYWDKCDATINGMLGGYEAVHPADIAASAAFLDDIIPRAERGRALDCGAGIGRVTSNLLVPAGFATVDLQDISGTFLSTAAANVPGNKLGSLYQSGLAEFDFDVARGRRWDLIWVQWCAIYLKDEAFVSFFRKAAAQLTPSAHACVVLKENYLRKNDKPLIDESDSSVTRSDVHMKQLWAAAGLRVAHEQDQPNWPKSLLPVKMYALVLLNPT